jgi:hypothetical protein
MMVYMYQVDDYVIKVFCKKSHEIVAGELFTEDKWYEGENFLDGDEPYYDIKGNTLIVSDVKDFDGTYPLIIDSWDFYFDGKSEYFDFKNYFLTEEEYKNKTRTELIDKMLNESIV